MAWVVAILAAAGWYFVAHWPDVQAYASSVGLRAVGVSLLVVTASRIALAAISRTVLGMFGTDLTLSTSYFINALAQLGKYVPGGVVHILGRIALYRGQGASAKAGGAAVALEHVALLGSATLFGLALAIDLLRQWTGVGTAVPGWAVWLASATVALGAWWTLSVTLQARVAQRFGARSRPGTRLFWLSMITWGTMGLAFWLLLPAEHRVLSLLPSAIGTFALAWAAGFVSPFAPAGLGVREAVIVTLLGPLVGTPAALTAAASSRIVWTAQELLSAPVAAHLIGRQAPRRPPSVE